jgi:large subunit ribosomal protein L15
MRGKSNKRRGSRVHGHGKGKSHNRGSGNRGGYGNAGSGKKAQCKKPNFWNKEDQLIGKFAFGMRHSPVLNCINVNQLQDNYGTMVAQGKVKQGAEVSFNLTEMGVEKLLGAGKVTDKLNITVGCASASAIKKIEAAGGKVTIVE